ncbi:MAG TPA: hypothetical protein VF001_02460, partial [Candidatus Limnocylindria bacterium]
DQADVESRASLRSLVHANDVLLDTVGPFQRRTNALLDVALERQADLVDLSDSASYARSMSERSADIAGRGIAVLTGCSAVSAVVATLVRASDVGDPLRIDAWLAPASRDTANVATARSFVTAVRSSTTRTCEFAAVRGMAVESGLSVQLPAIWPGLRAAAFWVDPHTRGARPLLGLAARSAVARRALDRLVPLGVRLARLAGTREGIFAVRLEGSAGIARWVLRAPRGSYLLALGPATIAVRRLAMGDRDARGLVPADQQVTPDALFAYLDRHGIDVTRDQPSL